MSAVLRIAWAVFYAILPFALLGWGTYRVEVAAPGGWAAVVVGAALWLDDMLPDRGQGG